MGGFSWEMFWAVLAALLIANWVERLFYGRTLTAIGYRLIDIQGKLEEMGDSISSIATNVAKRS